MIQSMKTKPVKKFLKTFFNCSLKVVLILIPNVEQTENLLFWFFALFAKFFFKILIWPDRPDGPFVKKS